MNNYELNYTEEIIDNWKEGQTIYSSKGDGFVLHLKFLRRSELYSFYDATVIQIYECDYPVDKIGTTRAGMTLRFKFINSFLLGKDEDGVLTEYFIRDSYSVKGLDTEFVHDRVLKWNKQYRDKVRERKIAHKLKIAELDSK
jgi:hypothetical protein